MPMSHRCYHSAWMFLGLYVLVATLGWTGDTGAAAYDALTLKPGAVRDGQVWRVATYFLLCHDPLDLLANLLIFLTLAVRLERIWGTLRFVLLMTCTVLGGGIVAALLGVELAGSWAPWVTIIVTYGYLFPEEVIYFFFVIPMRVRTLAIISLAVSFVFCLVKGLPGLAYFAGMMSGVIYYFATTRTVPWLRRAKRTVAQAAAHPIEFVHGAASARSVELAARIVRNHDAGRPISDEDRKLVEDLAGRADAQTPMCAPYSFSPGNTICPPCAAFGRCLKRHVTTPPASGQGAAK